MKKDSPVVFWVCCTALAVFLLSGNIVCAQSSPPPASVVTAKARSGKVTPTLSYLGTIEFPEISHVAAEVSGRVEQVDFEEGDRVTKGQPLAAMDTAIAQREYDNAKWAANEGKVALELATKDLRRMQALINSKTITQQDFDTALTEKNKLEYQYRGLQSTENRLADEIARATIRAPFDGIVLEKNVVRGEWLSPGKQVAVVARDDAVDVVINVPESIWIQATPGISLEIEAAGRVFPGTLEAAIAQGDIATRTFPVKVRAKHTGGLAHGMQARVRLPAGTAVEAVLVPRDAMVSLQGQDMIFAVLDKKATPVPVEILRYDGLDVALSGPNLTKGMEVVIKGNERLRPGQPVASTPQQQ